MALDAATAGEILRKLAEDQRAYLETLHSVQELLARSIDSPATAKPAARITSENARRNTGTTLTTLEVESVKKNSKGSIISDEDEDDDNISIEDPESLFVSQALPEENYDEAGLRKHLREYPWTSAGRAILQGVPDDKRLFQRNDLFPTQAEELRQHGKHLPYYSILDVGPDGAPLPILLNKPPTSRAKNIWERIQKVNADPNKERKAVGRITVIHEPSPLLFGALHYTMSKHFDVDELFQLLVDTKTDAIPHRPFSLNTKHRKTFVWTMEYFTIVGDECIPMKWHQADENLAEAEQHIPVSRCSSVIALSLEDKPMGQIRNKARRQERKYGDVYDPFSPWHVLSMQAYPDWRSSIDTHNSSKHYLNGPEAFLVTLRTEFKDAQRRLREVYKRISELVATPLDFMFRQTVRDKLLFEDDEFTYSRRYFWAYQSLAIMNEDIQEMISAYRHTFRENVWNGKDKIIWPGDESTSTRHAHWRKRMALIREDIEEEIRGLELINRLNDEKMKEIKSLRDNLFSGTSVLESRRSVQQQAITVQQGHNIKILTLVTIFFLPLTFVTSVFGMTNMNPDDSFIPFGIVTACICFPTYLLIGSLNTTRGLQFWTQKPEALFHRVGRFFAAALDLVGLQPKWTAPYHQNATPTISLQSPSLTGKPSGNQNRRRPRSVSTYEGIAAREGLGSPSLGLAPSGTSGKGTVPGLSLHAPMPAIITPAATMDRRTTIHFDDVHTTAPNGVAPGHGPGTGLEPTSLGTSEATSAEKAEREGETEILQVSGDESRGRDERDSERHAGILNRLFAFRRRRSENTKSEA